jgi:DNA-binding response OmpR family regulator
MIYPRLLPWQKLQFLTNDGSGVLMTTKSVLIVEDNHLTLALIQNTLDEARTRYQTCTSTQDGWNAVRTNPAITNVLVRMKSNDIDGCELTRRIRDVRSAEQLPVLMIVGEEQLELAGNALDAGANDVLIDPFEARELRMRINIHAGGTRHRVDMSHALENGKSEATDAVTENAQSTVTYADNGIAYERISSFVVPVFDPVSMRFTYGASEEQVAAWKSDESVTKVALDQIMVCPCCSAVPTFRLGCGCCGSAAAMQESLVHHYACAHIGAESEFHQDGQISCPKCRQKKLVAGSDFEVVPGGFACSDCGSRTSELQLIGHCLSCQHRFPAHEAAVVHLTGLHVHRIQEVKVESSEQSTTRQSVRSTLRETVNS